MKRLLITALLGTPLLLLLSPSDALAQTDPEATLFVGYSFLRPQIGDADRGSVHGGQLDYTYYLDRRFGFTVSASGHWGTVPAPPNIFVVGEYDLRQGTFLAGPHFVAWRGLTSEVGIEALAGAVWRQLDTAFLGARVLDEVEFAWAVSASLDLRVADRLWVRLAQPSIVNTKFGDEWRSDLRLSIGLMLRSGQIIQ